MIFKTSQVKKKKIIQKKQTWRYSFDLFDQIAQQSTEVFDRYTRLSNRLKGLSQQIPKLQKSIESMPLDRFQTNPRAEYSQKGSFDSALFTRGTIPNGMKETYEKRCVPPPNLAIMDPVTLFVFFFPLPPPPPPPPPQTHHPSPHKKSVAMGGSADPPWLR